MLIQKISLLKAYAFSKQVAHVAVSNPQLVAAEWALGPPADSQNASYLRCNSMRWNACARAVCLRAGVLTAWNIADFAQLALLLSKGPSPLRPNLRAATSFMES